MRIFLAFPASPSNNWLPESKVEHFNFVETLSHMGNELVFPPYDVGQQYRDSYDILANPQGSRIRADYSQRFLDAVRDGHWSKPLDLVLTMFMSGHVEPGAIDEIRRLGIPTVNYYADAATLFHLVAEIAPHYDLCWCTESFAPEKYRAVGANPIHLPMAANPRFHQPYDLPVSYDVTFVGQRYGVRPDYVGYLYQHGVDVRVWGAKWRSPGEKAGTIRNSIRASRLAAGRVKRRLLRGMGQNIEQPILSLPLDRRGPPLCDDEMVKLYSRSRVSLGFSELTDAEHGFTRSCSLRDFEAPMCRAFYLAGYVGDMDDWYEVGKEVVCYENREDLLDKVRYYLAHDREREAVRAAGWRRALQDHTWEKRFNGLFSALGLRASV